MAETKTTKKAKILMFRGRPLLRNGPQIYYGNMSDPYIALLTVTSAKEKDDLQIADKVFVQILSTNSELRPRERVAKKTEKPGLYEALQIASIWLDRMLAGLEA